MTAEGASHCQSDFCKCPGVVQKNSWSFTKCFRKGVIKRFSGSSPGGSQSRLLFWLVLSWLLSLPAPGAGAAGSDAGEAGEDALAGFPSWPHAAAFMTAVKTKTTRRLVTQPIMRLGILSEASRHL